MQNLKNSKVELLSHFGSDDQIVNVARVSYGKTSDQYPPEQNRRLINYLIRHGHTSPLRHCIVQFRIKCPIYVERQIFKHQVGVSVNSISGRYVDFSDTYSLIPLDDWRKQSKSSKQGSEGHLDPKDAILADEVQNNVVEMCKKAYSQLISLGVSKEQARSILPLNLNTEFIWTGSLQAFIHLCDLRLKPDAQKETRDIVAEMLRQVQNIEGEPFKYVLEACNYGK